jgi:predicted GTPase
MVVRRGVAKPRRVVIMGAGGRDFHNYLVYFRDNPDYEVVAFTATQIPGIEFRRLPPSIAGDRYPAGIPIYPEEELPRLVRDLGVDEVVLAYSDLTYEELGRKVAMVLASGASFRILGPRDTMLPSVRPTIAVTAVKTGAGKSTVSRSIVKELKRRGLRVVVVRHPMAYGDLEAKRVIVIEREEDLDKYPLTVEEREEFELYPRLGVPVLAGVDYRRVLLEAERRADVILWDGGNNDWPFIKPDYMIAVADALRPGLEVNAFPGEVNVRMADAVVVSKVSEAREEDVKRVVNNVRSVNPRARIVLADLEVSVDRPELLKGRRAVVVEDSPTVTHGGAPYGAGYVAVRKFGGEVVDPKPYAVGIIKQMYQEYPHMGPVVPSTGYSADQLRDLEETLRRVPADVVVIATPARIEKLIRIDKPFVRVSYELVVREGPSVRELVDEFLERVGLK